MASPQISVIIPLYNKRETVERALRSVLAQTIQEFEVVVVNDGSTDGGADVVRSINDPRIRLIEQPNAGVSAARNRGIAESKHDLIAFLDADDEWLPEFLQTIVELHARYPRCGVFATGYYLQATTGERWGRILRGIPSGTQQFVIGDYFAIAAQSDPPIWSSAVAVKRNELIAVGGFPQGVASGEDLLTWARLAVSTPIALDTRNLSVFHFPQSVRERAPRLPAQDDLVVEGLSALLHEAAMVQSTSLRKYLGLVHTMRAAVYLDSDMPRMAARHALKAAKLRMFEIKPVALLFLGVLPGNLGCQAYRFLMQCKQWHGQGSSAET